MLRPASHVLEVWFRYVVHNHTQTKQYGQTMTSPIGSQLFIRFPTKWRKHLFSININFVCNTNIYPLYYNNGVSFPFDLEHFLCPTTASHIQGVGGINANKDLPRGLGWTFFHGGRYVFLCNQSVYSWQLSLGWSHGNSETIAKEISLWIIGGAYIS